MEAITAVIILNTIYLILSLLCVIEKETTLAKNIIKVAGAVNFIYFFFVLIFTV